MLTEVGYTKSHPSSWRHGEKFTQHDARFKAKYLMNTGDIEFKYTHSNDKDAKGVAVPRYVSNKDRRNPGFLSRGKYKSDDFYLKYRQELSDDLEFITYANYYKGKNFSYSRKNKNYVKYNDFTRKYGKVQIKKTYMDKNYAIIGFDYLNTDSDPVNKVAGIYKIAGTNPAKYKYMEFKNSMKTNYGIFGINKINYDKFQFTQGIRYDHAKYNFYWRNGVLNKPEKIGSKEDAKYSNYSMELSANYLYSDSGSAYLSFIRAFRSPTISEMVYTRNSEKLKSQIQNTLEFGIKDFISDTYITATTFYKWTKDELYSAIPPEFTGMVNYNIGDTRRIGFEGFAEHYFGDLSVNTSITYINHKVVNGKYKNSRIPSVPNWKLTAGANYNITPNMSVGVDWLYYSKSLDLDDIENTRGKSVNGYNIFNISAYYAFDNGLKLTARIENIFDKKYDEYAGYWDDYYEGTPIYRRQYYPAIGRNYTLGMEYKF